MEYTCEICGGCKDEECTGCGRIWCNSVFDRCSMDEGGDED